MPDPDLDEICRVLGVARDADAATVKKAYRALAMRYHPDRNPDDPEARIRFDDANRAYATWAASQGSDTPVAATGAAAGPAAGVPFDVASFQDIFADFFGGAPVGGRRDANRRGADRKMPLRLSNGDALVGCRRELVISRGVLCAACKGSGDASGELRPCASCGGSGTRAEVKGLFSIATTCADCRGRGRVPQTPCRACKDGIREVKESLQVTVPAGVATGQMLRIQSKGDDAFGGAPGDLYLSLEIEGPTAIKQRDSDAVLEVVIDARRLLLGGKLEVPTLEGHATVSVPRGVRDGASVSLRGRGFPKATGVSAASPGDPYRGDVPRGDQIVVFRVPLAVQEVKSKIVIAAIVSAVVAALCVVMMR